VRQNTKAADDKPAPSEPVSAFERFVAAVLSVPREAVRKAEAERAKRPRTAKTQWPKQ